MIELLIKEISHHGDKAKILPIDCLRDIKQDIEHLKNTAQLSKFSQFIINDIYALDVPTDFEKRSLIIIASSSPIVKVGFEWDEQKKVLQIPATYADFIKRPKAIERYLQDFLSPKGYHVAYAPRLPRKLLAVRSGLGVYGRNNICYVEGMGSFLNIAIYFSDIPAPECEWHEIRQMDACTDCGLCLSNCPTGAITPDDYMIKADKCLTYFNESGIVVDFPEWIDPASHNSLYGCLSCQTICPVNKEFLANTVESVDFTEEETTLLMLGKPFLELPERLQEKVNTLEMFNYLGALPRNLRILLGDSQEEEMDFGDDYFTIEE